MLSFLTVCLSLLAVVSVTATANSFSPRSREEISDLPLRVTLGLLHERGVGCQDCSAVEAADELFQWQHLPVQKTQKKAAASTAKAKAPQQEKGEEKGKERRSVQDQANVQEVLRAMRKGGFGLPSAASSLRFGAEEVGRSQSKRS